MFSSCFFFLTRCKIICCFDIKIVFMAIRSPSGTVSTLAAGRLLMTTLYNFPFSSSQFWDETSVKNGSLSTWHFAIYDSLKDQASKYILKRVQLEIHGTWPKCVKPQPSVSPTPSHVPPLPFFFTAAFRKFIFIAIFCVIVLIIAGVVLFKVIRMRLNNVNNDAEIAGSAMWNELVETQQQQHVEHEEEDLDDEDLEDQQLNDPKYYVSKH